ncbi:hypothetical protein DFA_07566 [Cavenderia fasciculata]|uniref:Centromere protein X n=1 Tax=Cavenderia fasciculata TaxID=261658 RepID=F4PWS8_CACFS|nr:uncharacterized protein DFA_07566 [Cavenderia fasciculata]EGG20442.1 hypothetical protein DFA_07566 [Cavenderia fasciculata]|eukprot:XP_004367425.1 hypothetical protein DFA_07566 [Cavenderia fasciculata]
MNNNTTTTNNELLVNPKTVESILRLAIKDKIKISKESTQLTAAYLEWMIAECFKRMTKQAEIDEASEIGLEQLEKIMAQLLMDFMN